MTTLFALSPLLCIVAGGLAMMLIDAFASDESDLSTFTAVVLGVAAALSAALGLSGANTSLPASVSNYLAVDSLALFFDVVICGSGALTALLSGGYLREHELERGEFYPLLLFTAFGALVLARSADILTLFVGLETMSLGVYALIAFRRTSARAAEGAIKYFLLGSFATAILLFGSALLYGATGQTQLVEIGAKISSGEADVRLTLLSMLMLLVGLAFKVSAVPFHMWTPDAYEGAMTPVTTFMAVVVKAAVVAVFLRVLVTVFGDSLSASPSSGWPPVLAALAALTMVYGNLSAVVQSSVKRMLAYSSIAHAGYILVGLVAIQKIGSTAVSSVLFYIAAYAVSNALAFGALVAMGSKNREAVSYEDLAGAGRRHPMAAVPFVIGVLSLMGFPPTAGFFAKYYVFNAAVEAGGGMVWLAIIGVLSSAIGSYYYLKVVVYLFMKAPEPGAPIAVPMKSSSVAFALVVSCAVVLQMGVAPSRYLEMAVSIAKHFVPA